VSPSTEAIENAGWYGALELPASLLRPRARRRLRRPCLRALAWWLVTRQVGVTSSWVLAR